MIGNACLLPTDLLLVFLLDLQELIHDVQKQDA